MTTKTELKAKPQTIRVKFETLLTKRTPNGDDAYELHAALPFEKGPGGYSKWATKFFLRDNEDRIKAVLDKWPVGTAIELVFTPSRVKDDKVDDGQFGSYWWNCTDVAPSALAPGANQPVQKALEEPIFPEEGEDATEPPAEGARGISHYDARERIIGASWAVDQARQTLLVTAPPRHLGASENPRLTADENEERDMRRFLADVVNLARRYLAIRDTVAELGKAKKE